MITFKSFWQSSSPTKCPRHDAFPLQPSISVNKLELITKVLSLSTLSAYFQLKLALGTDDSHVTLWELPYANTTGCGLIESGHAAFAPALKKRQTIIFTYWNLYIFSPVSTAWILHKHTEQNMSSVIKHAQEGKPTYTKKKPGPRASFTFLAGVIRLALLRPAQLCTKYCISYEFFRIEWTITKVLILYTSNPTDLSSKKSLLCYSDKRVILWARLSKYASIQLVIRLDICNAIKCILKAEIKKKPLV